MDMKSLSAKEVSLKLDEMTFEEKVLILDDLLGDSRQAVIKLGSKILKEIEKQNNLEEKYETMCSYENPLWSDEILVAGLDEVGRGPLFGPVVTSCVILPSDVKILGLDDSKKIKEKDRERLYEEIMDKALYVSIGVCDNHEIDEHNILNATKIAMKKALNEIEVKPGHLLIDALELKDVDIPQTAIIKGDAKSVSIAAASIIAKVTRDRMIVELDEKYPGYDLKSNKGYGTNAHYDGIRKHGITEYHRMSFLKNFEM